MKVYFRLTIILSIIKIFSIAAMAQEAKNLIANGDFENSSSQTFVYDGVNRNGQLWVGANSSPAMADIDADGKKDLVVGSEEGLIYCYLNQGTDNAPKFTSANFFQPYYTYWSGNDKREGTFADIKLQLLDWDSDGKIDILMGTRRGWVFLLKGKGNGRFGSGVNEIRREAEKIKGLEALDIGTQAAPAAIDWNGDKKKDLILGEGTYGANSVYIFLNEGSDSSPGFSKDKRNYLAYGEGREHLTPAIIDWDGDGDYDLVVGESAGFLNLYLNQPPPRQVGEEENIAILDYSKKLPSAGGDIRLPRSTPSIVDWDNDGDFDIISGSADGRIYLFLNQGTKGNPQFSSSQTLKGEDKQASINIPNEWSQSYDWGNWTRRNGVYLHAADETEPYSGKRCLKVTAIGDYAGSIIIYTPVTLHDDKKYLLSFYTKGRDMKCSWDIIYSEQAIVEGQRQIRYPTTPLTECYLSSSWKNIEKKFELPTKGKGKARECSLRFWLSGKGPFYLDSVSLQEVK